MKKGGEKGISSAGRGEKKRGMWIWDRQGKGTEEK